MNKETLKRVIVDQRQELEKRFCQERVLEREGIKPCMKYLVQPNLLLVSGMRRAGKSFFAHILAGKNSYAFLNFDDERLMGFGHRISTTFLNVSTNFMESRHIFCLMKFRTSKDGSYLRDVCAIRQK